MVPRALLAVTLAAGSARWPLGAEEWIHLMDWRHRAACLEEDPELFFPIGNTGPALLQIEEAKAVCRRCDVVETCLRWALDTGQDAGVWGGLSEDERRALKRRNARARRAG
jgi:WhiB family transcriptional regulator, redox-sensing transcriptional regulator